MTTRREWLLQAAAAGAATLPLPGIAAGPSSATGYPKKPIQLVVPFPPGGPADVLGRSLAQGMSQVLGQPVVVDNKPGGNTIIGAQAVARAAPDGYSLLLAIDSTLTQNPALYSKLPYDPARDFEPIGIVAEIISVLAVSPTVPAQNVKQLIDYMRGQREGLFYGYGTITMQLAGEQFRKMAGVPLQSVAYKGGGTVVTALMTGDVPVIFDGATGVLPNVPTGKVKPLAVLGARRSVALPNLPTVAEAGLPGYDVSIWQGLVAPSGTPKPIVDQLNAAMRTAMADSAVQDRLEKLGIQTQLTSPQEMRQVVARDTQKWSVAIKELGLKLD